MATCHALLPGFRSAEPSNVNMERAFRELTQAIHGLYCRTYNVVFRAQATFMRIECYGLPNIAH